MYTSADRSPAASRPAAASSDRRERTRPGWSIMAARIANSVAVSGTGSPPVITVRLGPFSRRPPVLRPAGLEGGGSGRGSTSRAIPTTTLTSNAALLVSSQIMDGVGAGIFGVVSVLVIPDLTRGTGRFNLTLGAITTAVGKIGRAH